MCPKTCIAYTGPYKDLEIFPTCGDLCYDEFELKRPNGRVKKPKQHFYTMCIGPQLQALCVKTYCPPTVFMGSMDGAQLYHDKKSDCWILIWILMDIGDELRYKKAHVLPAVVIPGPNNPGHTDSFFFISSLQRETEGLPIWNALNGTQMGLGVL
ncbi:hypothetical protein K439DRAFT_1646982 [Ramaria rubella]|nr:hypothetical protein K439DRAFT_1646982 [Ramaria rubella]